jgi:two-component system sensor histidine kinase KdpD
MPHGVKKVLRFAQSTLFTIPKQLLAAHYTRPHRQHVSAYMSMSELQRPSPDALLAAIKTEAARQGRGELKVFLGMCPGVGKTYAMLQAAQGELKAGREVVVGYVETHGRKETVALAKGFETIPRRSIEYKGVMLEEMDLDAILARRPRLVLVDELAHTNGPGSRHPKRWQDVVELLEAGIHVFTTLNVQHVESRAETVRQITGAEIRETVPDSVLDQAVLELLDLPPRELVERLRDGKVYVPERAEAAAQNFFREGNLTALRELALRLVADHVGEDTEAYRRTDAASAPWKTGNRLLVAVGPSPLSEALTRWTRRMADELKCPWLAVHVEGSRPLSDQAQARLTRNLETARELGAEVLTTTDEDLARGLLRVARERNVTQIILGKPSGGGLLNWVRSGRLVRRLLQDSGDIDLHVIRAEKVPGPAEKFIWPSRGSDIRQYGIAVGTVAATGLVNLGLMQFTGPRVPVLVFLLAVVLLALFVGRGPVLLAGALSALAWNFFFLPPRLTLVIGSVEDGVLFGIYFVVSLVLGQLVARIRAQAEAERRREERSTALYQLTRELAEAGSHDEVVWQLLGQVNRVFQAPAAISLFNGDKLSPHPDNTLELNEKEFSVSDWALRNRKAAGKFTDNLPGAQALHLPLATERNVFGVLAVALPEQNLSLAQRDLLETFARQAALVLDRVELRAAAEQTRLVAESERLSRVLLNSISHELRTPLAASTSATSTLAEATDMTGQQRMLVGEIQEANRRLNRIVGNLLEATRLEAGKVVPRLDWYDARDLVQTTIRELQRELADNPLILELPPEPMLVRCDFSLTQHALANLLVNAVVHTPRGTRIEVATRFAERSVVFNVGDRGPGIPVQLMPRIFEKFFRAPDAPTGGSGLGLTIAKGFIEAQGGAISAENRPGGGALFNLKLPQPEKAPPLQPASCILKKNEN